MAADDEDADHRDDDRDRDRDRDRDASGRISHPSKRRFRGHVAETPSHPGGVNEDVRRDISDRRREHRDRRVSARSGDRDDRRGDDRRGDDRRDDRRRRRDGSRDRTRDGSRDRTRGRKTPRGRGFRRIARGAGTTARGAGTTARGAGTTARGAGPTPRRDVAGWKPSARGRAAANNTARHTQGPDGEWEETPYTARGGGDGGATPWTNRSERVGDDAFPSTARGVARRPGRPAPAAAAARRIARNSRSRAPPRHPFVAFQLVDARRVR